jgi:hypothetical protein
VIYRILILIILAAVMQIVGSGILDAAIAAIPKYGETPVTVVVLPVLVTALYLLAVIAKRIIRRA